MYFLIAFARDKGKRKLKDEKLLEISIPINVGCSIIFGETLVIMERFMEDIGVLGLYALEK